MNPFHYQRPLDPARLIDRREELDALQRAAADRIAVRLASPRRFGKTTLLGAHLQAMRDAGHHACLIDLDRVATVADVADRIVDGLRQLPGVGPGLLEGRLARLGLTVGPGGLQLQVAPRAARGAPGPDESRAAIRDLLELPAELAAQGDLVVVAIDEFQDLLTADDRLDGLLRSVVQHQRERVAYVFAGSSPSMMRVLFADRQRPFFGQARPLDLPPLPTEETTREVLALLPDPAAPGVADATARIVAAAGGHPQRTMLLAHHLYDRLDRGAPAAAAAEQAVATARDEVSDVCDAIWRSLDRGERVICAALADGVPPTSTVLAAEHGIPRSTLQRAVERLLDDGQHVGRRDGGPPQLLDPLFASWIRHR
ncbi:AAA family ATPase [Patulibacter defluvii]|uniref:AAA family ATPase n=1 Tax=Patulibacter defluvii TaxID=3095358 RepID=UPI002A749F9C|nr:hypothetical protein [Patulibacter sp. DM4]